jgi:hypothetical protein
VAVSQVSPYPFSRTMPITQEFHEAIKGRTDGLRRALGGVDVTYGQQNRTGTQYIDLTIINRAGMFVR